MLLTGNRYAVEERRRVVDIVLLTGNRYAVEERRGWMTLCY